MMVNSESDHGRERIVAAQAPTMLALETSTAACSVALIARGVVHSDHRIVPREHNRLILPMVDSLLASAGVDRRDLNAVAFGRGPGSFTGVRIAAGIAQGIALGLSIPVVPVSSLAALAQSAAETHPHAHGVLATIRSRADEIYLAGYGFGADRDIVWITESVVTATQRDLPPCVDSAWWVVGDGLAHFDPQSFALRGCGVDAALLPSATGVLTLALRALARGESVDAAKALPVYLQGTRPWRKLAD
jgi:tRNA threonylcarbamoyladenosine biosynthesis protein TsaB